MFSPDLEQRLTRDRFGGNGRRTARADSAVVRALENASVFSGCSKRELKLVAKLASVKEVRSGTTLMVEGEAGDTMLVLLSGGADVRKGGRKIAELRSGDVVGELAVLSKAARNATVTTRTDADIAVISRRDVFRLIEDAPGFSRKLLEALSNRLREMDRRAIN